MARNLGVRVSPDQASHAGRGARGGLTIQQASGHCSLCAGPVTSRCEHVPMSARARRRLAVREQKRR